MDRRFFAKTMFGGSLYLMRPSLPSGQESSPNGGITDVAGLRVGNFTHSERPTGCTVVLAEGGAVAGVDVRGSAPGTRETDLLDPVNTVQQIHGVCLSGGSAFGLEAATGVVRYLASRGVGFPTGAANVPIVPAAILYDLGVGDPTIWPDSAAGYAASEAASTDPVEEGNVGAGAGATVGKAMGIGRAMKGGLGTSSLYAGEGIVVGAVVAVNAVGNIVDPSTGAILAGARNEAGDGFVETRQMARLGNGMASAVAENTTVGVVATNGRLSKSEMTKVAQMAQDGLARTIYPAHTPFDGDTVFALSTGMSDVEVNVGIIGAMAAEVMADAILRGVKQARSIPGFPAYQDLVER